eukprot:CAMPEP_0116881816 /NCGR_PEP_ID=MMETSP0463-20121206/13875_1 /TAXON_ID=181622 /ORGANISM="Strombidinopsis sp, Strain SopsisLIS2011" /LENGTH=37 /DNA_ID= /DNA_START= /DNA_END= /DNA_ORIENTATION=
MNIFKEYGEDPILRNELALFEFDREELMEYNYKRLNR